MSNEKENYIINKKIKRILVSDNVEKQADIVMNLLSKPNLILDEDVRKMLSKSEYWTYRLWIAKDKQTSEELLKEMFKREVREFIMYGYEQNIDAIIQNTNFKFDSELNKFVRYYYPDNFKKVLQKIKYYKK